MLMDKELYYPKLKEIVHLLSIFDEFDVTLDDIDVGIFNYEDLIENYGEAYVTYITYGFENYGEEIFMAIELVSDRKIVYKGGNVYV